MSGKQPTFKQIMLLPRSLVDLVSKTHPELDGYPDHNTTNRFRGVRTKEALRSVFDEVVTISKPIRIECSHFSADG